jgi:magnesium transporter
MRLSSLLGPDIRQVLKEDPEQLRVLLDELHPEDLADIVSELEPEEAAELLARVPARDAAPIFERLEEHEQEEIASEMPPESVAHIASEMEADDRADLLSALSEKFGEQVLESLERVDPEAAEEVREIERWPDHSAGRLMNPRFVAVSPGMRVEEALAAIRSHATGNNEFIYTAYALEGDRLVGVISVRDLILAEPRDRLSPHLRRNLISVLPTDDQEEVARKMAKYDLNAIPVMDHRGEILGIVTIDDALDVLTAEQTEDVQRLGGIEPLDLPYFKTGFLEFIRKRGVWLVALFLGEFFTQTALRHYDPVFEAVKGATYYIPLLISAGGNSGSQSSTLIIRGMAVGEIRLNDWWRILVRELAMGVILGTILGAIGFVRVLSYPDQTVAFAVTIALTLIAICVTGCTLGAMIPMLLKRVGLDPATSSTPFIASLVDVLGIIVFVHIAKVVLANVIARAGAHAWYGSTGLLPFWA